MYSWIKYLQFYVNRTLPPMIGIEISNVCNIRCEICPLFQGKDQVDRRKRKPMFMSFDLFSRIIQQLCSWRCTPQIYLNMFGEPLLDPGFEEKIKALNLIGLSKYVYLQTNAMLLDEHKSDVILRSNIGRIVPAFDSYNKARYERIRAGASFDVVKENILRFADMRNKMDAMTRISIQYIRTHINKYDYEETMLLFENKFRKGDKFNISIGHAWASPTLSDIVMIKRTNKYVARPVCPLGNSMIVLSDGSVPCCGFDYNLEMGSMGDASIDSLSSIWKSKKFFNILNDIYTSRFPSLCAKCAILSCDINDYVDDIYNICDRGFYKSKNGVNIDY